MADPTANVRLSLTATAENVVLVREMLAGVADSIGLDVSHLNDIQTAVTEACNNVVLHAYAGEQGPFEVEVLLHQRRLAVRVLDRGIGINTPPATVGESDGIGLHVIRTLARTIDLGQSADGGTLVCMEFEAPQATPLKPDSDALDTQTLKLTESPSTPQ